MSSGAKSLPMDCRLAYLMGIISVDKETREKIETISSILSDAASRIGAIMTAEGTKHDYGRALETISLLNEANETAKQSLIFPLYNPNKQ